jgi:FSR family fosmidomycin resistance protein-like MFS transporter
MSERQGRQIYLLSAGHLLADINQGALPAILPFLISDYGYSYTSAASLVFALNFISSIVQPVFGALSDKIAKPWIMAGGVLLAATGLSVSGWISSYPLLFGCFVISGIGIAAFHPEAARYANMVSGQRKGTGLSIFSFGGNLGLAVGPILTMSLIMAFGLKGTSVLLPPSALMAVTLYVVISRFLRKESVSRPAKKTQAPTPGKDRWGAFALLCSILFCRSFIFHGMNVFLPLYLIKVFKQPETVSGSVLSMFLIVGAVSSLIGGRMADRFGFQRVIRFGCCAVLPLAWCFSLTDNAALAIFLLIPLAFAMFIPFSSLVVTGQRYLPNRIGFASGITLGVSISVGGIAAPILGRIADIYGLHQVMLTVAAVGVLPAALSFVLPKSRAAGA